MKDNGDKWAAIAVAIVFLSLFGGMAISESFRHMAEGQAQTECIKARGNWSSVRTECTFSK